MYASVWGRLLRWVLERGACRLGSVRDGNSQKLPTTFISRRQQLVALALLVSMLHTFREQPILSTLSIPPQKPAIAKVIIALYQLNAIPPP